MERSGRELAFKPPSCHTERLLTLVCVSASLQMKNQWRRGEDVIPMKYSWKRKSFRVASCHHDVYLFKMPHEYNLFEKPYTWILYSHYLLPKVLTEPEKSLHVVSWILFLLLLTSSCSTCLQHSPNHVQRLFSGSVYHPVMGHGTWLVVRPVG